MSDRRIVAWTTADGGMHTLEEGIWNPQDTLDGRALRLLREATAGRLILAMKFPDDVVWEVASGNSGVHFGATFAEAADKCREALR